MSTPRSFVYDERDETAKQLTFDSRLDTTGNMEWWKNLEPSDSDHNVSTNSKRNHSAVIAKAYILETSTSESEKEVSVRKKKVPLRAASRKSGSNAFINALSDTKAVSPSRTLAKRQAKDSILRTNASSRETSRKELHENNEDSSDLSSTVQIAKVRPSIFKRNKKRETNDQNGFQDVLAENDIAREKLNVTRKKSSKHSIHGTFINTNKSRDNDQSKITESPRSVLSSSITKKRLSNITAPQIEADIDQSVMNSSLNDKEIHKKKHVFLKPKSRILTRFNSESLTENLFEEALMEDVVLKPKSGILGRTHNRKSTKDSFEEVFEVDDIDTEDNTAALTKNKRTSVKRNKASLVTEENSQLRDRNINTNEEYLDDISHKLSSSNERSVFKKLNTQSEKQVRMSLESTDAMNVLESVSRKSRTTITPVKSPRNSSNRISKGKASETLEERTRTNTLLLDPTMESDKTIPHLQVTAINDGKSRDDTDEKQNTSGTSFKRLSKSHSSKEVRVTRSGARAQAEASPITSRETVKSPRCSVHRNAVDEENDDMTVDSEIGTDNVFVRTRSSAENSKDTSANKRPSVTADKSAMSMSVERHDSEITDDHKNATRTTRTDTRTSTSLENKLNKKTASGNVLSIKSVKRVSNRIKIKAKEVSFRQQALGSPPIYHNMPVEVSSKNVSKNTSKLNSSKTTRTLQDFFKAQEPSAVDKPSVSTDRHVARSQVFTDTEKIEKIKQKLERIKRREIAAMKMDVGKIDKNKLTSSVKSARPTSAALKRAAQKPIAKPAKVLDKAYLVNGEVYRAPRLPRPKYWATDRLYKFLWRHMEPRYKLATRVQSEKFVQELATMVSRINRCKKYDNYKPELIALMKEMARLRIISTRNDFYHFCHDFLPYEFRVKVVPILLPGNKRSVPYNPENLHTPLLNE